jgi:hypothetical protein
MSIPPAAGAVPFAIFALPMLAPAVAVGAAALAISVPVLIHLLSRQRYQVVPWAAMRFLLAAQKQNRRRIDRWLLLAARMLALLLPLAGMCAATAWAEDIWQAIRPGPPEVVSNAPRTHRILVIDGSLSLTARADNTTRFDVAIQQAEQAIRSANAGDGFTLIYLAGPAQAIVPGPSSDPDKVQAELHNLKPTHGTADLASGLALTADALAKSPRSYPRRQVLLFTDLQRSGWAGLLPKPDGTAPDVWQRVLPRAEVAVVDAAGNELDNLAVTDLTLADPLPLVDAPTAITVAVQNFGRVDRHGVRLELSLGRPSASGPESTLLPIEQRVIESIPAGQRVSVTFALEGGSRFREAGLHLLQAKLVESDDLPADDARAMAIEVREGLTALLVNGKPAANPLRRATEYLHEALAPGGRPIPGNPARPRTLSLTEFADPTLGDLTGVDCVFLCDVPTLTPAEIARLEAHLKRGGGIVFGLGPTATDNLDLYNRLLFNNGNGMLPGKLLGVRTGDEAGFRLAADEDAYRRPPLAAFRDDNARAGLTSVPFKKYVQLDAPADGRARRVLSFVPATSASGRRQPAENALPENVLPDNEALSRSANAGRSQGSPEPAVIEWPRHRGRVIVYTSTFNTDWTDWPVMPSFLPFAHEVLRFAAANPDRHTVRVGEAIEEFLPVNMVGLSAQVSGPGGLSITVPVVVGDESGLVRFADPPLAGIYRVSVGGRRDRVFAVNVPESSPGGGSESDLRRLEPSDLRPLGAIQVVTNPTDATLAAGEDGLVTLVPRPHGPTIARWFIAAGLVVLLLELWLAWRFGPARSSLAGTAAGRAGSPEKRSWLRPVGWCVALVPVLAVGALLAVLAHYELTGELLGFLPEGSRHQLEQAIGVPEAGPGEGTRWRLEGVPALLKNARADGRLVGALAVGAMLFVGGLYLLERRAAGRVSRVAVPLLLRAAAVLFLLFILLPQLRLAFDREGWPDVAVLLDTSASMATVDELQDPGVRAKASELMRVDGLSEADRLRLAKLLIARPDADLLTRLLTERQVKVHLYSIADQAKLIAELNEPGDANAGKEAINQLKPDGESSRLGDCVRAVLKSFRGGSLAGVIAFTDGVTTAGEDLTAAGRDAARAGVPLYLVGIGDAREPPDLILSDLKSDDVVLKGDQYIIEARLTARGPKPPQSVPVVLYERQGERLIERARQAVRPDPSGKPVPVRLMTTPTEVGEKTYIIDVPVQPGEAEAGNNRAERVVLVVESKRLRVLYVEGHPRYEFRFAKSLLERETDAVAGNKSIELRTLLLDASPGYAEQDKSALRGFPTRSELFEYDVVIWGDVDPAKLPKSQQTLQDLAEFVKIRGGGLLIIAGEHASPYRLFGTPLADLLPVVPSDAAPRDGGPPKPVPLTETYRPKLTPIGQNHPLFRFAADEAANARVWAGLKPMFWAAPGYKRKLSAEVLAVHPTRPAEGFPGENHPLALQQFVGAGRVIFFGFDETWRWRFRESEEHFNQFWVQAIRVLSRSRVARAELRTDKQTAYRRDEPIRLTVRFPDDAPPPAADVPVKVSVERSPLKGADGSPIAGSADSQVVQLAKVEGTRATYQTLLTRTPEGEYRFYLTEPTTPGSRPRAEAKVLPPPGERERLEMNKADLLRAAAESRGKFYALPDAEKVIDDLPDVARVPLNQPVPPIPLWNNLAAFALLLALLACEWLLRRRERLL